MPRLAEELIAQIADANDIVEVINGYFPLKRAGATYKALCPFHQERSPSFTVNPHRQIFKCFGCGAGGTVFQFVMDYEHLDFPAAARRLAERAGIRIVEQELSPEDNAKLTLRKRLLDLHAAAADWFHAQLMKGKAGDAARQYLKSRGLTSEIARGWKIGYAPDSWDACLKWAERQGYSGEVLAKSGLITSREPGEENPGAKVRTYDRFRDRVMFPICNDLGEVIAFSGRTLEANPKAAKYVNSPETPLFTKGAVLFGLHRTKRALIDKKSAIVCEGQLDLITAYEAGVQNVTAPQGTAFTDNQAHILKRYVEEVVLCFDADTAGEKAAERSLVSLLAEGLSVRLASMPPGEDPDSLIRSQGAAAFLDRINQAKDFFDFQLDRFVASPEFTSPVAKSKFIQKAAGWIRCSGDRLIRDALIAKVASRLEIATRDLSRIITATDNSAGVAGAEEVEFDDNEIGLLIFCALTVPDAHDWLREQEWDVVLEQEAHGRLLRDILQSETTFSDPSRIASYLAGRSAEDSAMLSRILDRGLLVPSVGNRQEMTKSGNFFTERRPTDAGRRNWDPMVSVRETWQALYLRQIRRRVDALQAQLRTPGLPIAETLRLHKEILDHQGTLLNIARPLSPSPSSS
jgi:DNA primase